MDVTIVGHVKSATSSTQVVRIVHISDTHLGHNSLTPPRPLSGNISIRRSISSDSPNQIIDEKGKDAFEKRSNSFLESHDDSFHKGGVFLSNLSRSYSSANEIPCGDILIHSGDFDWSKHSGGFLRSDNFEEIVQIMNDFFDRFPHKVKLFVAGNHEMAFEGKKIQTVQDRLISATYLCNSSFTYEGIHFYGAPYSPFRLMTNARGFLCSSRKIAAHWRDIPSKTDVLITHTPPYGILDLATDWATHKIPKLSRAFHRVIPTTTCETCGLEHPGRSHWGCPHLRDEVLIRIKPHLHLFGHVHEANGIMTKKGVTFANSSYATYKRPHIFDFLTMS
ncbi:hypothetical protein Btru_002452 [Bulinus truncatus]|nr:hypothetical protein Btru_002452 [Bulinus truncatus]